MVAAEEEEEEEDAEEAAERAAADAARGLPPSGPRRAAPEHATLMDGARVCAVCQSLAAPYSLRAN